MIKCIDELPLQSLNDKRVLMRVDFNVPISDDGKIEDDTRIREAIPTIRYAMEKGAKVILMSHLGRPTGRDTKLSLEPVAHHLSELLGADVLLTDECVGDGIQMIVKHLKATQVVLLENLRFHKEEEENDPDFAHELSALGDVYVNDAFGTAHRKHASTYGVPQLMPIRACGFLVKKELEFLNQLLQNPPHPFITILGGSKVADKMKTIENLFLSIDTLLVGGAMAHAFRVAQGGYEVPAGAKQPSPKDIDLAGQLILKARKHEVKLLLPTDDPAGVKPGFDIGPKTVAAFKKEIATAKVIFWNGPLGMFEEPEFAGGTTAIAQAMAENPGLKVIGGGDTVSAINHAGLADQMSHLSTGGGATLEYLEGAGLPGIQILETSGKRMEAQANMPTATSSYVTNNNKK